MLLSITADAASLLLSPITPADIAAGAAIYPPVAAEITIFPQAPEVDTHASVNSPSAQILVEILIPTLSAQLPPIEPAVVQTFIEVLAPIVKGGASVDIGAPVSIVLATPTPGIVAGGADVNINAETGIIQISVFEGALVGPITGALSGIFGVSVGRGLTYAKGVSDRRKGVGKPNASEEF